MKTKTGLLKVANGMLVLKAGSAYSNGHTAWDNDLDHGSSGFQRWIGWGVIAGNLVVIGRA